MPQAGTNGWLRSVQSFSFRQVVRGSATVFLLLAASSLWAAGQKSPNRTHTGIRASSQKTVPHQSISIGDLESQYPGLLEEFGHLFERIQANVQTPEPRGHSRLLEVLPQPAMFYLAVPNYGESVRQALETFHQELQDSAVLRQWWKDSAGSDGAQFEDGMKAFYQLSESLGDEVVISSPMVTREYSATLIAEVRKPGLQEMISSINKAFGARSPVRVYSPQQLASTKDAPGKGDPVVLLRPDFVVAAFDLNTLRDFNSALEKNRGAFANTEFGRRMARAYESKTSVVAGIDLRTVISQNSGRTSNAATQAMLRSTGFAEAKYGVWEFEHGGANQLSTSVMEVSFAGTRHGVASWLGSSGRMGGLEFISPKPGIVYDLMLKNPAQIYDDVRELATATNPRAFGMVDMAEQSLHLSIKNDILSKLTGEIAVEMDSITEKSPEFTIVLRTNDPAGLQQSLEGIFSSTGMVPARHDESGFTSFNVQMPNPQKPINIYYAFVDNYLVIAMGHEKLANAIHFHRTGQSLANSQALLASLPAGTSAEASGIVYQNLALMLGSSLGQALRDAPPQFSRMISQFASEDKPSVMRLYADSNSIRVATSSSATDPTMALVAAAVAIPNLLRSRMAANESAAASTIRTVNTAQVTYATIYPARGYARNLAALGPGNGDCSGSAASDEHACLVDAALGGPGCTSGTWCQKGAYRYSVKTTCTAGTCKDYVVVATPATSNDGSRSYCSVSDAVVRVLPGTPLSTPITAKECRQWTPIH